MSVATTKIKSRIKSVTGAYKVTGAMKLVSTVKLKKYRNKMLSYRSYSDKVDDLIGDVLGYIENVETRYALENKNADKDLFIIVTSSIGLCGSYNNNIFRLVENTISEKDDAIILGKKGVSHFKNGEFVKLTDFKDYSGSEDDAFIRQLISYITREYEKGTYHKVHVIYSRYKSAVSFVPTDYILLPVNLANNETKKGYGPLLEPDPKTLVDNLMPFYLQTSLRSKLLESEVCEQGARSNAMENATNNAKKILDSLELEFNKARQGAITQEIIEIVGASQSV